MKEIKPYLRYVVDSLNPCYVTIDSLIVSGRLFHFELVFEDAVVYSFFLTKDGIKKLLKCDKLIFD